jgi:hypothetical protein
METNKQTNKQKPLGLQVHFTKLVATSCTTVEYGLDYRQGKSFSSTLSTTILGPNQILIKLGQWGSFMGVKRLKPKNIHYTMFV